MKVFWTIFSFYILILSAVPCTDSEDCAIAQNAVENHTHSHDDHSHESDHCTPFCSCSCCGISSTIEVSPKFDFTQKTEFELITKEVSHYKFVYSDNYFAPIWQPPKISA